MNDDALFASLPLTYPDVFLPPRSSTPLPRPPCAAGPHSHILQQPRKPRRLATDTIPIAKPNDAGSEAGSARLVGDGVAGGRGDGGAEAEAEPAVGADALGVAQAAQALLPGKPAVPRPAHPAERQLHRVEDGEVVDRHPARALGFGKTRRLKFKNKWLNLDLLNTIKFV